MKTIIVTSRKGGAGKTTLTVNLATQASAGGKSRVVVLDADPQGSATFWQSLRSEPFPEVRKVRAESGLAGALARLEQEGVDYAFLDFPPADKKWLRDAMADADLVLIPTKPSPLDIHSATSTLEWALDAESKVAWVINGASVFSKTPDLVFDQLRKTGSVCATIVHERNDFVVSAGLGLGVSEFAPNGKAAFEIDALWKNVRSLLRRA
ncbi:MAG: ParA family protein [Limnobacter sp.]|nr:ParA family protein [Limnobacter sp.]